MKPYQNVCLDDVSVEFENGSCWNKNSVTRSNLKKKKKKKKKNLEYVLEATFSVRL